MAKAKQVQKPAKTKNKSTDGNREFAFMLFMQRVAQNDIAERSSVSVQTISDWKKKDNWEAKRAAKTISIDELVVKALKRINEILDDPKFDADAFAKSVAQLKTLKTKNTVDDEMMCFMDFQSFLFEVRTSQKLTGDFIRQIVKLQDLFITKRLGNI